MAIFNSAVLTRKGNELLIDAAAGNRITFTRMIVGCGEYTDAERERSKLEKMENLKDAKQEFTFSAYKKVSEQCFLLTVVISNRELAKGYKITEIGVYGKISDDSEDFLCSIAVTNSIEESDTFPPYNGLQECQIVQDYYVTISPDAEVTVITKGASVLIEDFLATIEEIKQKFEEKIEALKKSFQDGVDKIYIYLKGLGFTPADRSPDEICNAIQRIYDERYGTGYDEGRRQGQQDVINNPSAYGIALVTDIIEHMKASDWRTDFGGTSCIYTAAKNGNVNIWFRVNFDYDHPHGANAGDVYIYRNNTAIHKFSASDLGYNVSEGGYASYTSTDFEQNTSSYYFDEGDEIRVEAAGNGSAGMLVVLIY